MNDARANPSSAGPERRDGGWSRRRWAGWLALVFAAQVAIIFAVGEKHFPTHRKAVNVPQITLVDGANELIALNDPTLFALPPAGDFALLTGSPMSVMTPSSFRWKEPPGELPSPSREQLGAIFNHFVQSNRFAAPVLDFKPQAKLSEPVALLPPMFAGDSMPRIAGDLAQRQWLNPVHLTNWPYADVIAPSRVQVLVDKAGDVVSAVLLPSDSPGDGAIHYDSADMNALQSARTARFSPALRRTIGQMIFDWRTVAPPSTNSPVSAP